MGRITNVSNGTVSGKVGPAVYYSMNGKEYVRAAPGPRPKGAWSAEQVGVRNKIGRIAALWRQMNNNPVRQIWKESAQQMSAYNLFLKTNLPAFRGEGLQADLEFLHLSAGELPFPHHLEAVKTEGEASTWNVSWKDDSGYMLSLPDDELMVIFAYEGKFGHPVTTGALRGQETVAVQAPADAKKLQGFYLYFASPQRKLYSTDQFIEA